MLLFNKCLCVLLFLFFYPMSGHALKCYVCNSRDHIDCLHIPYRKRKDMIRNCKTTVCGMEKAQYGFYKNKSQLMLWRGCGHVRVCGQEAGLCCHCNTDYCNYNNKCYEQPGRYMPGGTSEQPGRYRFNQLLFLFSGIINILI